MSKAKLVLTAKIKNDEVVIAVKEKGDIEVCLTMALQYIADNIVEHDASIKDVTKLLKDMVKNEKDRRGESTWL